MKSLITILIIFFCSCKSEEIFNTELYSVWEAKSFFSVDSRAYPRIEKNKILLTLYKDGKYRLKLDINNCSSEFSTSGINTIVFAYAGCTEACCDSEFSNKLTEMLPLVTCYKIEGKILKLEVPQWGWIEFEKFE